MIGELVFETLFKLQGIPPQDFWTDSGMAIFRSTDSGKTWKFDSYLPKIAETGFLHLGGRRMLAAFRNESGKKDGTIVTLAGDGQLSRVGRPTGRHYTLQAVRWKPWPKGKKGGEQK